MVYEIPNQLDSHDLAIEPIVAVLINPSQSQIFILIFLLSLFLFLLKKFD